MRPDPRPRMSEAMVRALDAQIDHMASKGFDTADRGDVLKDRAAYRVLRAFWQADGPHLASVRDVLVPTPQGRVAVRVYNPKEGGTLPAVVFAHGGGWYLGGLDTHDRLTRRLALESGAAVVAVDYRLAPEHKHPAAIEDVRAVLAWLADPNAGHGLDGTRVALAGDSAGAHTVLAAAQAELGGSRPAALAMVLFYGYFGLGDGASYRLFGGPVDGLAPEDLAFMFDLMGADAQVRADPAFDLLAGPVEGLPPARIVAAELDPLVDDSRALAALIEARGGTAELAVVPGVIHAFVLMDRLLPEADRAIRDAGAFLARHLHPNP